MPKPKLTYTLHATNLTQQNALLYRSIETVSSLHNVLDVALHRGARIITIRAIHPIPEPKGDS